MWNKILDIEFKNTILKHNFENKNTHWNYLLDLPPTTFEDPSQFFA